MKEQLAKANEAIEGMKDYDQVKGEVEKYKAEMETANKESQEKIRKLEIRSVCKSLPEIKSLLTKLQEKLSISG